jgi:uncharacterized membrane protein HdeD (DUF308 family)
MDRLLNRGVEWVQGRWSFLAALGIASVVLGTVAIVASFMATLATVFFLGCLILGGGIVHFVQSLHTRGWTGFFGHALTAILYGVAGWYMIVHPAISAAPVTLVIGMLLAVGGLYQLVTSIAMRYKSWGWALLNGVVSLALGIFIFAQWPVSALWVIGTFVGIDLIFRGWATFMLALSMRDVVLPLAGQMHIASDERRLGAHDRRAAA